MNARRFEPHTVTFDCWQTLIFDEPVPGRSPALLRAQRIAELTGVDVERAAAAFSAAWHEHQRAWHRRSVFAGPEMLAYALDQVGATLPEARAHALLIELEDEVLSHRIHAIEGTRELLQDLRAAGVRTALICDTGFTPGRVVRQLLARVGLLEHLEVHIFSNELRVPKPHPRAFSAALEALGVPAQGAVHVGDLRRSDIAGARAAGMGTVRFAGANDDSSDAAAAGAGIIDCAAAGCEPHCERPEADRVAHSYAALGELLRRPLR